MLAAPPERWRRAADAGVVASRAAPPEMVRRPLGLSALEALMVGTSGSGS
jgi:hypothetical protein